MAKKLAITAKELNRAVQGKTFETATVMKEIAKEWNDSKGEIADAVIIGNVVVDIQDALASLEGDSFNHLSQFTDALRDSIQSESGLYRNEKFETTHVTYEEGNLILHYEYTESKETMLFNAARKRIENRKTVHDLKLKRLEIERDMEALQAMLEYNAKEIEKHEI